MRFTRSSSASTNRRGRQSFASSWLTSVSKSTAPHTAPKLLKNSLWHTVCRYYGREAANDIEIVDCACAHDCEPGACNCFHGGNTGECPVCDHPGRCSSLPAPSPAHEA